MQSGRDDDGLLIAAPIVIEGDLCAVNIEERQCWVLQGIGNVYWWISQTGSNRANNHLIIIGTFNDKATNHDPVARFDQAAGRDVT